MCSEARSIREVDSDFLPTENGKYTRRSLSLFALVVFNPSAIIEFTVPENGRAALQNHDTLGRAVANVYDGEVNAGYYQKVVFEGGETSIWCPHCKTAMGKPVAGEENDSDEIRRPA